MIDFDDFVLSVEQGNAPSADLPDLLQALWWAKKETGIKHMILLRMLKARMVRGFTPICIESKEIWGMLLTGILVQVDPRKEMKT